MSSRARALVRKSCYWAGLAILVAGWATATFLIKETFHCPRSHICDIAPGSLKGPLRFAVAAISTLAAIILFAVGLVIDPPDP